MTRPRSSLQVPAALPRTSANGRKSPFVVTIPVPASPSNGVRSQAISSGSKAPSIRGGGTPSPGADSGERTSPAPADSSGCSTLGGDRLQTASRAPQRDPRPPREVASTCGPMSREKASGELCEGRILVGRRPGVLAEPVGDGDEALAGAAHRTAHDQAGDRRRDEHVDGRLARAVGTPASVSADPDLVAGARTAVGEQSVDDLHPALGLRRRDALLLEPAPVRGRELRKRQRLQPTEVGPVDEMQRAAVEPGDDQGALVEQPVDVGGGPARRPDPDRETGAAQVLGLDREQMPRRLDRAGGGRAGQQLGAETALDDIGAGVGRRVGGPTGHRPSGGEGGRRARRAGARRARRSSSKARSGTG